MWYDGKKSIIIVVVVVVVVVVIIIIIIITIVVVVVVIIIIIIIIIRQIVGNAQQKGARIEMRLPDLAGFCVHSSLSFGCLKHAWCCQTCSWVFLWKHCSSNLCFSCTFVVYRFSAPASLKFVFDSMVESLLSETSCFG